MNARQNENRFSFIIVVAFAAAKRNISMQIIFKGTRAWSNVKWLNED